MPREPQSVQVRSIRAVSSRTRVGIGLGAFALTLAVLLTWFWTGRKREGNPTELRALAVRHFNAGRVDQAEQLLKRLAQVESPNDRDRLLHAMVLRAHGRPTEAIDMLGRVSDASPLGAEARLRQGQMSAERGRTREAEHALLQAVRLDPTLAQARRELIYLYTLQARRAALSAQFLALSKLRPLPFNDVYLWCLGRRSSWEPRSASAILKRWVAADPSDRESRLALAENLRQMARYTEARELLRTLPDSDADARALRTSIALNEGNVETAESLVSSGPSEHPGLAKLRGRFALVRHDWHSAAEHYRAAVLGDPNDRDAVLGLGQSLMHQERGVEAAPFLDRVKKLDALESLIAQAENPSKQNDPRLVRELADTCASLGRFAEARAWWQVLLTRNPLDTTAHQALFRIDKAEAEADGK